MPDEAFETKLALPYACTFMERVDTEILENEHLKPWV